MLLQFGPLSEHPTCALMAPVLKDRTLPSLVGDPLGCLAPGQGMCSFRILGPASSGQAGMVEKSCTKWLCLVLPAVVAVPMGGCQTLLHRQLIQRCRWSSLPRKGTASLGCAMASNLAIADPCSMLDWPAVDPDRGIAFCLGWTWHGKPGRTAQSL